MFCKKGVLKILQTQENNCARICFLLKLQAHAWNFLKRDSDTFFIEHLWWLLLTTSISYLRVIGAVVPRCSVKKVFMKISQHSQEGTCAKVSFLIKLQDQALLESYPTTGFLLTTSYLSFVSKVVWKSKIFLISFLLVIISYRRDKSI